MHDFAFMVSQETCDCEFYESSIADLMCFRDLPCTFERSAWVGERDLGPCHLGVPGPWDVHVLLEPTPDEEWDPDLYDGQCPERQHARLDFSLRRGRPMKATRPPVAYATAAPGWLRWVLLASLLLAQGCTRDWSYHGLLEIRELFIPGPSLGQDEPLHLEAIELGVQTRKSRYRRDPLLRVTTEGYEDLRLQIWHTDSWYDEPVGCDACFPAFTLNVVDCRWGATFAARGWQPDCAFEWTGKRLGGNTDPFCQLTPEF